MHFAGDSYGSVFPHGNPKDWPVAMQVEAALMAGERVAAASTKGHDVPLKVIALAALSIRPLKREEKHPPALMNDGFPFEVFAKDCLTIAPTANAAGKDILHAWTAWAAEYGFDLPDQNTRGHMLRAMGAKKRQVREGKRRCAKWCGLGLSAQGDVFAKIGEGMGNG